MTPSKDMYNLRGRAFVPLVVSSTSSEDAPDVEELRLARVVVDAADARHGRVDSMARQSARAREEAILERWVGVRTAQKQLGGHRVDPNKTGFRTSFSRRGRPPGSTKKKKEAALAAQAALAAAGGLRAPGRVNPELEPTDDEIEAELNTMLGAPAAAAALADVKQEA